jgi:hypothetical protein
VTDQDTIEIRHAKRGGVPVWAVVIIIGLILVLASISVGYARSQSRDSAQDAAINGLTADSNAYRKALSERGVNPNTVAPPPAARTGDLPVTGAAGAPGANATDGQVIAAVTVYFAQHPVANGKDATPADIAAAVAAYISAHPPAAGPAGTNGTNGNDGNNATDTQVAAAVDAYCTAHSECRGPEGKEGPTGPVCPAGQSMQPLPPPYDTYSACKATPEPSPSQSGGLLLLPFLAVPGRRRLVIARHGVAHQPTGP